MEVAGSPQGIARRALRSRQITLTSNFETTPIITVTAGCAFGVRRVSGSSTTAEVWGLLENDTVWTRMHDSNNNPISVPLGSFLIPLHPDVYLASQLRLVAADAVVRIGGKT